MVPKFQVAVAYFSCNLPELNLSELSFLAVKDVNAIFRIIQFQVNSENQNPLPQSQAIASNNPNVFTFMLPVSDGRAGEAVEPSK
jgi:hypothetical protein